MSLHKFEQTGQIKPAHYWVNEDRELVRVLIDGDLQMTLSTREAALKGLDFKN